MPMTLFDGGWVVNEIGLVMMLCVHSYLVGWFKFRRSVRAVVQLVIVCSWMTYYMGFVKFKLMGGFS